MNETTWADNARWFNDHVLPQAYTLLVPAMASATASAMLLAIGLQEGRLWHRRQIGGPAHGAWQFEKGGGVVGVLAHSATKLKAATICTARNVLPNAQNVYDALPNDDILACCFARLLLYTLPGKLPAQGDYDEGWRQYTDAWRPGMPHRSTWNNFYDIAWATVT